LLAPPGGLGLVDVAGPVGASGARLGDGLAGRGKRDLGGLVDGRDIHRGADGFAVDCLDIGDFPRAMLSIDPDVEAYDLVRDRRSRA